MQLTCSNCGARYAVDPTAIGPKGRTVQCVRCNHRWFQESDAPPPASALPPNAPPAPALAAPPVAVPDVLIRPSTPGAGLPAVIESPRRSWGTWIAVAIVFVVLFGAAGYAYRGEIKARLPASWRTALKLDAARNAPAPSRAQLGINMAATKIDLIDGRYIVLGELINNGTAPGSTRRLKVVFRAGDQVLAERAMPLVEGPIAPGARMSFRLPLDEPPSGATNIVPSVD